MKYNLDDLHWQEFETLSFKALQILIAPGVKYLSGGNDKGRDFIYTGTSAFNPTYQGEWLFQAKHKSKELNGKELAGALSADLKSELIKVFVKNKLSVDNYFLITNKMLSAEVYDTLVNVFKEFKEANKISCSNFDVISYHAIATCIDGSENLKWAYPNIIAHPDFEVLIQNALNLHLENRRKGWLSGLQKQRERFVYSRFFQSAWDKLSEYPAIILSGPPKSGKTFNAEMLALNLSLHNGFQPILVESIDDMEGSFRSERKQVFIFDDAFGKYSLSYDSGEWFSRLEHIFELADELHLFIFTSREYVFRQFINYGNEGARELLQKIIVESHGYSKQEKLSLLGRYTILSPFSNTDKIAILNNENSLTEHRNFSPETVRAFFYSFTMDSRRTVVENLVRHLDQPDSYLAAVFFNLPPVKQAVLLSILCSVANSMDVLKRTFGTICKDLQINTLTNAAMEFDELDDSILRISRANTIESVRYYHPSMQEFLIRQMVGNEATKLKEIVLMNLNTELLSLSHMKAPGAAIATKLIVRDISLVGEDLNAMMIGMDRLVNSRDAHLHHVSSAISWFSVSQHTLDLRINDPAFFSGGKKLLNKLVSSIFAEDFFINHSVESCKSWSNLIREVKNSINVYGVSDLHVDVEPLLKILVKKREDSNYWTLVFRALHFVSDDQLKQTVGRDWLNGFFLNLKKDIDTLGVEVYGEDYPHFYKYAEQIERKERPERVKAKPNRTWYPRFRSVEDRIEILKEVKGKVVGNEILERLTARYDHVNNLKDYAKHRHQFIVGRGWWKEEGNT